MQETRVERLRVAMKEANLPALFITNSYNRQYMTGFTGSSGYVLITAEQAYLLTDFRYTEQAANQVKHFEVVEHTSGVMPTVLDLLGKENIRALGFEQAHLSYMTHAAYQSELADIELIPSTNLVENLRMFKDAGELQIMQEAADLADLTFSHILNFIKPGVTEKQIALEMEIYIRQNGGTSTSFDTIVASGERSALPHGVASDRVLGNNEFVKLDFGAYYKGYCSDITRTVVLGTPSDKHKEIYGIVLEAQLACLDGLKSGLTGQQGDALARDVITKYGYGAQFGHSTGHGLGMEVHESPSLSSRDQRVLMPGMVVTVEPGIYIPGFGGVRIEDDVVITEQGINILTKSTKELLLL
ncbi:aminopeptidase P family protein [Paenibacillus albiflavus]|uniref:Aminopeptidase P family protein n=1 Tax=Paenibacillus albiflavus TaxID=2545760 RepID=A0A4R4ECM1_9BACL|nr:Xaa-Pro peptidase family protein [Paenibacillus albiflavus]TCZ77439.1 aminopeptidase P family protein [Paenibacillus albiflavus]